MAERRGSARGWQLRATLRAARGLTPGSGRAPLEAPDAAADSPKPPNRRGPCPHGLLHLPSAFYPLRPKTSIPSEPTQPGPPTPAARSTIRNTQWPPKPSESFRRGRRGARDVGFAPRSPESPRRALRPLSALSHHPTPALRGASAQAAPSEGTQSPPGSSAGSELPCPTGPPPQLQDFIQTREEPEPTPGDESLAASAGHGRGGGMRGTSLARL